MDIDKKIDISVIIPMYNTEKYIGQCIESLLNQSHSNFEIICVDDGSDDNTCDIIRKYKRLDDRISLIEMPHCGKAGVMRNEGMKYAKGEYWLFLDADDFFESEMLEKSLQKIKTDQADLCLFDGRLYNEKTKQYSGIDYLIQKEYIPEIIPFEGKNCPYIFNITTGCPWNKLIKRSIIEDNKLQFMDLKRSNDVFFVFMALAHAKRITILQEVFVNYRRTDESLQANNAETPWDWYKALKALSNELMDQGIYADVEKSLKNLLFGVSIYNLCSLKKSDSYIEMYNRLKTEVFEEFSLEDFSKEDCYSYNSKKYEIYQKIKECDVSEYLFNELAKVKQEKSYWVNRAKKAEKELRSIKDSTTLKVGKMVLKLPRMLKRF